MLLTISINRSDVKIIRFCKRDKINKKNKFWNTRGAYTASKHAVAAWCDSLRQGKYFATKEKWYCRLTIDQIFINIFLFIILPFYNCKDCKECKSFVDISSLFCIFINNSIKWMESTQNRYNIICNAISSPLAWGRSWPAPGWEWPSSARAMSTRTSPGTRSQAQVSIALDTKHMVNLMSVMRAVLLL